MKYLLLLLLSVNLISQAGVPVFAVATDREMDAIGRLENQFLRVSFLRATGAGQSSAQPAIEVRTASGWVAVPLDPSAESYQVLVTPSDVTLEIDGFYPRWRKEGEERRSTVIWDAGSGHEAVIKSVTQVDSDQIRLEFHPLPIGSLEATWRLAPGEKTIQATMTFVPSQQGQFSLGYFLFKSQAIEEVDSLLMPMMVQGKRFPSRDYTLLQTQAPTPISLMQTGSTTWAVSGDRGSTPFEFPIPAESRYGLHIRNPNGQVQPSIYGPLVGTPDAHVEAGETLDFTFRILVQSGDWYDGYRTVVDEVFDWRDYRINAGVSLTEAALNMIDLYMDDEHGGWWNRARANYQIESKNGSTQSSPLTAISLYRLTGDREIYKRRTLPTLEFLLSRDGPHFSPIPENTGGYAKGSMNGPADIYGTTVYAGLWEMTNRRTPIFYDIALPDDGIRLTATQQNFESHNQPFDEWLGRYVTTGEQSALDRAVREADAYIVEELDVPPTRELGLRPFFLMAYTPTWEGLLRLYEVTKKERFLEAAARGANVVMTGMWTQPTPADGEVVIHPGGFLHGDKMDRRLHKGTEEFRLGWPRQPGDTPEKTAPAWLVSNVGLGFEQPSTYTYRDNGGRMIFQAPWTSSFLRLASYTGDSQFETYARNAVVGRWGNYPGYYYTTFTDIMADSDYPYEGPDVSFVYYHHILVHLSWTLDYLVSEALLRSNGEIRFPALRQFGYAYFDNLIYGHAPGEVMGQQDVWLWFRRGLVSLDNPQLNYLTAHNGNSFFVIMMNQNHEAEEVTVTFEPSEISPETAFSETARVLHGQGEEVRLHRNAARVTVGPRDFVVLQLNGLDIDIAAHRLHPAPAPSIYSGSVSVAIDETMEVRAAAIQVEPGPWHAYVWSTAASKTVQEMTLTWKTEDDGGTLTGTEYPYEFSIPVPAGQSFSFRVSGIRSDGSLFDSVEDTIGLGQ